MASFFAKKLGINTNNTPTINGLHISCWHKWKDRRRARVWNAFEGASPPQKPRRFSDLGALDGLKVRAQHIDELVCLHHYLSLFMNVVRAFRPRCTDTFTADSQIPDFAAALLTLNPSNFTHWIACLVLAGTSASSLSMSRLLSTRALSSCTVICSARLSGTSLLMWPEDWVNVATGGNG